MQALEGPCGLEDLAYVTSVDACSNLVTPYIRGVAQRSEHSVVALDDIIKAKLHIESDR